MPQFEFPCASAVNADISIAAGSCDITAEERTSVYVEVSPYNTKDNAQEAADATEVGFEGNRLVVKTPEAGIGWLFKRQPSLRIIVKIPSGSNTNVKGASADVAIRGQIGKSTVITASGSIDVESANEVTANTASGDVKVIHSNGRVHANSASGDIELDHVDGEVTARSASGDVRIGHVGGSVSATTASGDVLVRHGVRGVYKVRTVSGEVSIGVGKGVGVWIDLNSTSGRTSSDLAVGDSPVVVGEPDLNLQVRTVSGDIEVVRSND